MLLRIALICLLTRQGQCQNPSPCPNILMYEPRKEQDRWYGVLSLRASDPVKGDGLRLTLDRPAELLGNWFGDATSRDNREYVIKRVENQSESNSPVSVRFFVKYNSASTVPSLTKIQLNGKTICPEVAVTNEENANVSEPSESTISRPTNEEIRPQSSPETNLDYFPGDFNIPRPTLNKPNIKQPLDSLGICGTVARRANPLISRGQNTTKGQWPWHAALYRSENAFQLMYTCGGTLVSREHVITAAHCVVRPNANRPIDNQNILIYLGKHNLKSFGDEVQDRGVSDIFIHPQYDNRRFFNDIAVLKLSEPVEFSNYVRPCCLWNGDDQLELLTNKWGTVVGWGFNENRQISSNLMKAEMPVIDTIKCIYSNREFFSQFTFEKTFCAGFRNGTSVCNGDSGGGMVFPRSGTSSQDVVWQLRGLVSIGVALQDRGVCDTTHYTVFTDVAKHLEWIRQQMKR